MRVARGIATLSIASVAVLGLTACSSSDAPKSSSAVDAGSEDSPSSDPSESTEPTEDSNDSSGDLTADNFSSRLNAASQEAGSLTMIMETGTGAEAATITTDMVMTDDSQNMSMTISSAGGENIELRVVDKIVYMTGLSDDGKFTRIDPSDPSDPNASITEGLLESMDPNSTVSNLDGAITSLKKVGSPVDIDGVKAQQYEVVIDTSKLSGAATEDFGVDPSTLPDEFTYQYWVDEDDLMRKMVFESDGVEATSTFTNWGEDLNIAAPSADQITNN